MKKTLLIVVLMLILMNCQNIKKNAPVTNTPVKMPTDTSSKNNQVQTQARSFTNYKNVYFDSLNYLFTNNKNVNTTIKEDLICGDTGFTYKIMVDDESKSTLYIFEWEGGEYGFADSQFYFKNDSLVCTREFRRDIAEDPTDTTSTVWRNKEIIYILSDTSVLVKERERLTQDDFFTFDWGVVSDNLQFNIKTANKDEISIMLEKELNNNLDIKEFEEQ